MTSKQITNYSNMKTYYVTKTAKGTLKLQDSPGSHIYTIHSTTRNGAEECLRMLKASEKRLREENND